MVDDSTDNLENLSVGVTLQHMKSRVLTQTNIAAISVVAFLSLALLSLLSFSIGVQTARAATIDQQLSFGSTGQEVMELQTYLATDISLYPSRLVTGYFGLLTQAGVQRFQAAQGIVSSGTPATTGYGRVGPITMARLNQLMNGTPSSTLNTVPVLSPLSLQRNATSATLTWTTNEPTVGQVYYSTTGIRSDEATGPSQTPFVSGTLALDANGLRTNHSVTIMGLQPNTLYYYFVRSTDASGDMSVMLANTFQTTL